MKIKESGSQFVKFAIVGIINTAIDWLVFFALKLIPFFLANRPIAKAISFIIAAINSFILNSTWTFKKEYKAGFENNDQARLSKNSIYFGRFFMVSLIGWLVNTLVFTISINYLPGMVPDKYIDLSALVLASAAGIIWNFFANKYWTYNKIEIATVERKEMNKRRLFNIIGVVILTVVAFTSFQLAKDDSGIVDEVAHIPAGYGYIEYFDYRLNPEHPPLAKALAALPLSFLNLKPLDSSIAWHDINQWESGWDFIYRLGNDPDQVILYSRIPMIGLLILLGFFMYRMSAEFFGRKTAVLVLILFATYPDFLAHGHLVTTDVAAALGFTLAIYFFNRWVLNKTTPNLFYAGVAFGIAQLLKFSAVLLIPIFLCYIFIRSFIERGNKKYDFWRTFYKLFKKLLIIGVIGLGVIYVVYLPFVWRTPVGIEHQLIETNLTNDSRTLILRNFLHFFENTPFLRAIGHYILGIFLVFGRVGGGNTTYILGNLSEKGISWFFPVAWLIKTPIPIIILFLSGLTFFFLNRNYRRNLWLNTLFLTPILCYWIVTLKGSLNIGIRHLLPTVPFVILFIALYFHHFIVEKFNYRQIIISLLVIWMVVGSIIAYPNYMSYFNELTTSKNKYDLMVDSSLDWGQDLKRLANYVKENNIDVIKVDYFGGSVPEYYIPEAIKWRSGNGPTTGWLAVSATFFQSSKLFGEKESKWSYAWLEDFQPKAVIGNSILVYYISAEDLQTHPPRSPYPILKYDSIETTSNPTHNIQN